MYRSNDLSLTIVNDEKWHNLLREENERLFEQNKLLSDEVCKLNNQAEKFLKKLKESQANYMIQLTQMTRYIAELETTNRELRESYERVCKQNQDLPFKGK